MTVLGAASALAGGLAVALGAFGAHGLKARLSAEALGWWETGTFYLLTHAVAALAVALSARTGFVGAGGWSLLLGGLLFSATLYAMALGAPRWFGAITPIGGVAMIMGWGLIAAGLWRSSSA